MHAFFSEVETDEYETKQKAIIQLTQITNHYRANNNAWIDEVKDDLCQVLRLRKRLIVIFEFDSQRHHGNLEDAILEALFNG